MARLQEHDTSHLENRRSSLTPREASSDHYENSGMIESSKTIEIAAMRSAYVTVSRLPDRAASTITATGNAKIDETIQIPIPPLYANSKIGETANERLSDLGNNIKKPRRTCDANVNRKSKTRRRCTMITITSYYSPRIVGFVGFGPTQSLILFHSVIPRLSFMASKKSIVWS